MISSTHSPHKTLAGGPDLLAAFPALASQPQLMVESLVLTLQSARFLPGETILQQGPFTVSAREGTAVSEQRNAHGLCPLLLRQTLAPSQ